MAPRVIIHKLAQMSELINAINSLVIQARLNKFSGEVSVKELSEDNSLLTGSLPMRLAWGENNSLYPEQLQPDEGDVIMNMFAYEQIRAGSDLFWVEGEYIAENIPRYKEELVQLYNATNGTSFFDSEAFPQPVVQEFLELPFIIKESKVMSDEGRRDFLWGEENNGSQDESRRPQAVVSSKDSSLLRVRYENDLTEWPIIFGANSFNVHIKFSGVMRIGFEGMN